MARVLFDGLVEFDDGTPSTTSQMAKDVTTFLAWTAEPELDERKKMGLQVRSSERSDASEPSINHSLARQAVIILSTMTAISLYVKRFKWTVVKNRKLYYNPPKSGH